MRILWDEPKRLANLDKHGFDFADLDLDFFLGSLVTATVQDRQKALGSLAGRRVVVIFVVMGTEAVQVISLRPASRRERSIAK